MIIIEIRKQLHWITVLLTQTQHRLLQRLRTVLLPKILSSRKRIVNTQIRLCLRIVILLINRHFLLQEKRNVILHQHLNRHLPSILTVQQIRFLHLQLLSLRLVPSVLVPNFHLGLGEFEGLCQIGTFWSAEVSLLAEAALKFEDLRVGESCPWALFPRRLGAITGGFFRWLVNAVVGGCWCWWRGDFW